MKVWAAGGYDGVDEVFATEELADQWAAASRSDLSVYALEVRQSVPPVKYVVSNVSGRKRQEVYRYSFEDLDAERLPYAAGASMQVRKGKWAWYVWAEASTAGDANLLYDTVQKQVRWCQRESLKDDGLGMVRLYSASIDVERIKGGFTPHTTCQFERAYPLHRVAKPPSISTSAIFEPVVRPAPAVSPYPPYVIGKQGWRDAVLPDTWWQEDDPPPPDR